MIFRWSLWGTEKAKSIELLRYSILSFKKHFGNSHDYLAFTDNILQLEKSIGDIAQVIYFNENGKSIFDIDSKTTWRKWCPNARVDVSKTEIYVDSDVFLLKYPQEIEAIIADPHIKCAILDEFLGQPWQHGVMQRKSEYPLPFFNAGLLVQKVGFSISAQLEEELDWWKKNIPFSAQTHHDEQGALAIVLAPYLATGELKVLPKEKYMLIGLTENSDINNLEDVTLFHAVYPDHPAFYRFKGSLDSMLGIE